MPKMKTRRAVAKRVKLTATGRVKHKQMNLRHILTKKRPKRKRHLRQKAFLTGGDERRVKQMLNL